MNASVSLLPFAPPAEASERNPVSAPGDKHSPPGMFGRMLDRATHAQGDRQSGGARLRRSNSSRETDNPTAPTDARSEQPETSRSKPRKKDGTNQEELAGACAVKGQASQPETTKPAPEAINESPVTTAKVVDAVGAETVAPEAQTTSASALVELGAQTATADESAALATAPAVESTEPTLPTTSLSPAKPTAVEEKQKPLASNLTAVATEVPPTSAPAAPIEIPDLTPTQLPVELSTEILSATATAPGPSTRMEPTAEIIAPNNPVASTTAEMDSAVGVVTPTAETALAVSTAAVVPTAPEEARRVARATRRARSEALENPTGIGGAKSSETMKTALKKEDVAGLAQQFLPGATAASVPPLRNLPGSLPRNAASTSGAEALEAVTKAGAVSAHVDFSAPAESSAVRATDTLARVTEVISREIRMFKRGGDDLVEVVLTPDSKTQISLKLQWRDGQVEVQARCDLGDYQSLNQQWNQLQTSLANHGVRLSHLSERISTGFTEFFNNAGFGQNPNRQSQSQQSSPSLDPGSPPQAPAVRSTPAGTPRRSQGLFDSWA